MINFFVRDYFFLKDLIKKELWNIDNKIKEQGPNAKLDNVYKSQLLLGIDTMIELSKASKNHRATASLYILRGIADYRNAELFTLRDQIIIVESDVLREMSELACFLYSKDKIKRFVDRKFEWKDAIAKFPSITYDVECATDLYALEHNTACIFHCMKILEIGLKKLAKKFGVSSENWGSIIRDAELAINEQMKNMKNNSKKAKTTEAYSQVAIELRFFKDAWRNHVSHKKTAYSEEQAASVLEHTKDFMNRLSYLR